MGVLVRAKGDDAAVAVLLLLSMGNDINLVLLERCNPMCFVLFRAKTR